MTPLTNSFHVDVAAFTELAEIEGSWSSPDFVRLLERMEIDDCADLPADELREMCVLSLQDLEPAEAAILLLERRLGDALGKGQIQNIAREMLDEKLWEDYVDFSLHERFFQVGSLLYQAFPRHFPVPDAVEVRLAVAAQDPVGERLLAEPLDESFVVRLLAHGMPESSTLNRLFGDGLAGKAFPEAKSIAWIVKNEPVAARSNKLVVVGSGYWLDALRETKSYKSSAHADPVRRT